MQFSQIIDLWPSLRELWRDMEGHHPDMAYETVRAWRTRNSIKSKYFDALVAAAKRRGFDGVTYEVLSHAAAGREHRPVDDDRLVKAA